MEGIPQNSDDRPMRWSIVWKCFLIGLLAGLVACIYRLGIIFGTGFAIFVYSYMKENYLLIPLWIIFALLSGYVIYRIMVWEPSCTGSGVPLVKGQIMLGFKTKGLRALVARLSGGLFGGIFGMSFGWEGPSIHAGTETANISSKKIADDELDRRLFMTGGASAGLAAAFSAPLSGMVFVMEEIHHKFSKYVLFVGLAASLAGAMMAFLIFGMHPVLDFVDFPKLELGEYIWIIPCGIISGILGWSINASFIGTGSLYKRLPRWLGPGLAILVALPIGIYLPEALGTGDMLISVAERAEVGIAMMVLFLLVKMIFSSTSFGSRMPGGIFMPILAIGALGGASIGLMMVEIGMPERLVSNCAIYAMAGTLASSLRSPFTSIVLAIEVTGTLTHFLPVVICVAIAYLVSRAIHTKPIYDILLEQISKDPEVIKDAGSTMEELTKGIKKHSIFSK